MLREQFRYYVDHHQHFVKKYNNKFIVLKDLQVAGAFDTKLEAYEYAVKNYEPGTFMVQEVKPGKENYTQTFRTRVKFNG
ncbi:MAG: hypothetical protein LBL94_00875 [Prevotellaceae bacterium]|jgi:hypothetical protein|nr:hypothetical protein [Prevotellaceae bacterium]